MFWSALRRRKDSLFERVVPDSPARPEPTSITPSSGTNAGGTSVTIRGSGFQNPPGNYVVTSVTFNDVPATSVVVVDDGTLTCTTPAGSIGNAVVRLFGPGGDRAVPGGFAYLSPFTPADLDLTGWWRTDYPNGGPPWHPSASAGPSGANGDLAHETNDPTPGASLNGLVPAAFDGSSSQSLVSPNPLSTFFNAGGGTIAVLFNCTAAAPPAGVFADAGLFGDGAGGFLSLAVNSGGLRAFLYDGAANQDTGTVAATLGEWHLAQLTWDGVHLNLRVDGGATTTIACGPLFNLTFAACTGRDYNGTAYFTGEIAEIITDDRALTTPELDEIRGYMAGRYGVSV